LNLSTLQEFRQQFYDSLTRAADALFNTADALLTETQAHSFPELSLSPFFERQWPSLYEAFEDGCIDEEKLRSVFASHAPHPQEGERMWVGIDASSIERPESHTSQDRTVVYKPNLPQSTKPITYGWQFSTLVVLPDQPSSWTYILDQKRIESNQTAVQVAVEQICAIVPQLGYRPILTSDRYYSCAPFLIGTKTVQADKLLRVKRNRVFYRRPPVPTGKRGAPRKHGDRFQCSDPSTHGDPDECWQGEDEKGKSIQVSAWHQLHLRQARDIEVTLIRVVRETDAETHRAQRVSWFLFEGQDPLPLSQVRPGYRRRYSQEHGYRFEKQDLLWQRPHLRTPEQFERWSHVVAFVHNQLVLARSLDQVQRHPWESREREPTPQQVRRAMSPIITTLGTPAKAPKPRGKSPGRPKGGIIPAATRHDVVRKSKPVPKKPSPTA
jgi:DDE superfamily endonuclease